MSFTERFTLNFIESNRYRYITTGIKNTLLITVVAAAIGIALGFLIAIVRSTYEKTGKLKILNLICRVYLTVMIFKTSAFVYPIIGTKVLSPSSFSTYCPIP